MENIRKYYIQHKWVQYILWIFLVAGILSIVIPFVLSEGYTYLCDEFFGRMILVSKPAQGTQLKSMEK